MTKGKSGRSRRQYIRKGLQNIQIIRLCTLSLNTRHSEVKNTDWQRGSSNDFSGSISIFEFVCLLSFYFQNSFSILIHICRKGEEGMLRMNDTKNNNNSYRKKQCTIQAKNGKIKWEGKDRLSEF